MSVCAICGERRSNRESDPHGVYGHHEFVPDPPRKPAPVPPNPLREAASRAAVWSVIAAAAKARADEAKEELAALEVGDTIAATVPCRHPGNPVVIHELIGKATMTKGRAKLVITDESAFLEWVKAQHPSEVVESVNPAFVDGLKARAKDIGLGVVIDSHGEVVPGVAIEEGAPYVTVRKEKNAEELVALLLSGGQVSLDGIEPPKALPEPEDRYTQDRKASGL